MYDAINLGRRIDVTWPDEKMRIRGGRSYWKDWVPEKGMEGLVCIAVNYVNIELHLKTIFMVLGCTSMDSKPP